MKYLKDINEMKRLSTAQDFFDLYKCDSFTVLSRPVERLPKQIDEIKIYVKKRKYNSNNSTLDCKDGIAKLLYLSKIDPQIKNDIDSTEFTEIPYNNDKVFDQKSWDGAITWLVANFFDIDTFITLKPYRTFTGWKVSLFWNNLLTHFTQELNLIFRKGKTLGDLIQNYEIFIQKIKNDMPSDLIEIRKVVNSTYQAKKFDL